MNIDTTPLAGLLLIQPTLFSDERGYFFENFQQERYTALGLPPFVQDNYSYSKQDTLRGLHYQQPNAQGKLVWVSQGSVWDVVIDIRLSSPTFGQWFGLTLSDDTHTQLYVPPGFAHGFCVLSKTACFHYKCTDFYVPTADRGIIWNDPQLQIPWPVTTPILSDKDKSYPTLNEIAHECLFA
ncbi:MAG TPA: dTDP-4-dehydrorhamnose 3,5-epimerase [Gammaproteobacteria bacterium]|jgi:dTDP-4-dehydrorhamnose 3,5-epimerase|nr:dTDP-4-dehydrorhamnose 3,5-epimerase [Gammaproteobacteria bacterium]